MIKIKSKHLKMVLLGVSITLAPALSTAAGGCGSSCLYEVRKCFNEGNSADDCFVEYEGCMIQHGCDGWA